MITSGPVTGSVYHHLGGRDFCVIYHLPVMAAAVLAKTVMRLKRRKPELDGRTERSIRLHEANSRQVGPVSVVHFVAQDCKAALVNMGNRVE